MGEYPIYVKKPNGAVFFKAINEICGITVYPGLGQISITYPCVFPLIGGVTDSSEIEFETMFNYTLKQIKNGDKNTLEKSIQ